MSTYLIEMKQMLYLSELVTLTLKKKKKFISDFIPLFSPNLVANHTPISSITPPCYLDPPRTPRPWRPQLGSSDPEGDTPSPSRILSPV